MTDHLVQMLVEATARRIAWSVGCGIILGVVLGASVAVALF